MKTEDEALTPTETVIGWCAGGLLFSGIIWLIGVADWGIRPPRPELAVHQAPGDIHLGTVLSGVVDGVTIIHFVVALVVFHDARRLKALLLVICVMQLLLTGYLWFVARTALSVGGYTWWQYG